MHKFFLSLMITALLALPQASTPATSLAGEPASLTPLAQVGDSYQYLPAILVTDLEKAGERLLVWESGTATFKENTPFHVAHGYVEDPADPLLLLFDFKLEVDGAYETLDMVEATFDNTVDPPTITKQFVYNFPQGMTGSHTFTGHWLGPCSAFHDDCVDPSQIVEDKTTSVVVTFVP